MDEGTVVTTSRVSPLPKDWPQKPLFVFARIDGLIGQDLNVKNLAAKVLEYNFFFQIYNLEKIKII